MSQCDDGYVHISRGEMLENDQRNCKIYQNHCMRVNSAAFAGTNQCTYVFLLISNEAKQFNTGNQEASRQTTKLTALLKVHSQSFNK